MFIRQIMLSRKTEGNMGSMRLVRFLGVIGIGNILGFRALGEIAEAMGSKPGFVRFFWGSIG